MKSFFALAVMLLLLPSASESASVIRKPRKNLSLSIKGTRITSCKVMGDERLMRFGMSGFYIKDDGGLHSAAESESVVLNVNAQESDRGEIVLDIVGTPTGKDIDFEIYLVLYMEFDFCKGFRFDRSLSQKKYPGITFTSPFTLSGQTLGVTYYPFENTQFVDPAEDSPLRDQSWEEIPLRFPVLAVAYPDSNDYLGMFVKPQEDLKYFTEVSLCQQLPVSSWPYLCLKISRGNDPKLNRSLRARLSFFAGTYDYDPLAQAMLDARINVPNNDVFMLTSHNRLHERYKPTDRPVFLEWCGDTGIMGNYLNPQKRSLEDRQRDLADAKERYPDSTIHMYIDPYELFVDYPPFDEMSREEIFERYGSCIVKDASGEYVKINLVAGKETFLVNPDPSGVYGQEVLQNIATFMRDLPDADGVFIDQQHWVSYYDEDFDTNMGKSLTVSAMDFIDAMRTLPEMKGKTISANSPISPYVIQKIDTIVCEPQPGFWCMNPLYFGQFGKKIFYTAGRGYSGDLMFVNHRSVEEARFYNINPGAYGGMYFHNAPDTWSEVIDTEARMIDFNVMYYPELERWAIYNRSWWEGRKRPSELGFVAEAAFPGYQESFNVEYMDRPGDDFVSTNPKLQKVKTTVKDLDEIELLPLVTLIVERSERK